MTMAQIYYMLIKAGTWKLENVPSLWRAQVEALLAADADEWQEGVEYEAGDFVKKDGMAYKCIEAHTSSAQNTVETTTLWEKVSQ